MQPATRCAVPHMSYAIRSTSSALYNLRCKVDGKWDSLYDLVFYMLIALAWPSLFVAGNLLLFFIISANIILI